LLNDTDEKNPFFDETYQKYIELRDYVAAVGYALPVMVLGRFQN
jgi:hypothetical protein